ncbi:MAG: hypothetical protein AB7P02_18580 [Alphaproteobacteria bacterium]
MAQAEKTTDHAAIRRWVEARGGHPARVRDTADGRGGGVLRIDFGEPEERLEQISWDEFFETFEESRLAFLYQEETEGGRESRFSKLVRRDGDGEC